MGMQGDVIDLINVWLNERMYYVSIDGVNSVLFDLLLGTVQGSILGPVLYTIFVSSLFDLKFKLAFKTNQSKTEIILEMEGHWKPLLHGK